MKNENITPEALVADESFQHWVNQTDPQDIYYWNKWINQHPEHRLTVEEAVTLIELLQSVRKKPVLEETQERVIAAVQVQIASHQPQMEISRRFRSFSIRQLASAAAILTAVALTSWWLLNRQLPEFKTTYGEIKTVTLPDGSSVVLNANSTIRLSDEWQPDQPRELWLKGEAFFSVKHTDNHSKFIVHTTDADVEVLGTTFNVSQRQNKTQVVLNTGKVKFTNRKTANFVVMQPGEMIEVLKSATQPIRKKVNTRIYTAWKDRQLVFDATSLNDIAQMIKTNYGYQVIIQDTALQSRQFTYTFKGNDLDALLTTLAEALDLTITQKEKTIYIAP